MLTEQEPRNYIPYERLSSSWEEIQKIGYDKAVEIIKSWAEISKQNSEIYKFNSELFNEALKKAIDFFKASGVKWHKTSAYGKITGKYKEASTFYDSLATMYKIRPSSSPSLTSVTYKGQRISTCSGNALETLKSAKFHYEQMIKQEEQRCINLKEALKVAKEQNIDITNCETEVDIFNHVNNEMKEKWENEHYPVGASVYLKHACDECSTWYIGDRRCSCGNRRMSLCIEGDFVSGFYAYPEPY